MRRSALYVFAIPTLILVLAGCGDLEPPTETAAPAYDPAVVVQFGSESPPGAAPEPFALGQLRGGFHSAPVFAPDGRSVWWGASFASQTIYTSRYEDGSWTDQERVSFSNSIRSYRDPFISPDGLKFYFLSSAPLPGQQEGWKENLWMMDWESGGWSEPQPLPEVVNKYLLHWTVSVASNYDLYFAAEIDGNPDIFKSAYQDGTYAEPEPLGDPINTEYLEFTPHIAPDQSFLLFVRTLNSSQPTKLYISYATADGWSEPVQVENVHSCISPILTPDGSFVIYLKGPAVLEWRDTSFIEELRPRE